MFFGLVKCEWQKIPRTMKKLHEWMMMMMMMMKMILYSRKVVAHIRMKITSLDLIWINSINVE
jgi:hypothetical protein